MKSIIAWLSSKPSPDAAFEDERLRSFRITPSVPTSATLLLSSGKMIHGMLKNESDDGVGVLVDNQPDLEVGRWLSIILRNHQIAAEVRHITPHAEGGFVVGLRL